MGDDRTRRDDAHLTPDLLSAYLDGDLAGETVAEARAHLALCPTCRAALAELRAVSSLLSELPMPEPPRSFRLTPEMAPVREVPPEPWIVRIQPALRWATAVAAVLLVLVIGADLLTHRAGSSDHQASMPDAAVTTAGGGAGAGSAASSPAERSSVAAGGAEAPDAVPDAGASPAADAGSAPSVLSQAAGTPSPATPAPEAIALRGGAPGAPLTETGSAGWRLAELGLALLVTWLLVASAALPRLRRSRDRRA